MDKATKATILKVEHFSKLGASKLQDNPKKALKAYRQAYQSALLLGHNGYMQRACAFNLAAVYISTGSYTDGLTYLKQSEPLNGFHDGRSNGDLYFNYGLAYQGLGNTTEAKLFFSKALKEYQAEKDNVKMEADVISRLGKVCLTCGQYLEAETYMTQLIHAYEKLGDTTRLLQSQTEQANLLLRLDKVEEAEKIADDCVIRSHNQELSHKTVNILTELSLLYTQISRYDKALQCCQNALQVINAHGADGKQIAVLYQNLGVIHNYLGKYQDAIKYHQLAAAKHAETNNRKSQGHCFINLGYAYSQMEDIDQAEQYFHHSLQAAKDCDDKKSEWQSLEALGAVACHYGDLKQSQDYYKLALTVLASSTSAVDVDVQDRIVEKLMTVIKLQVHRPDTQVDMPKQEESQDGTSTKTSDQRVLKKVRSKDGSVIAVRKDGKVKYLRVRRSGTLHKFNKVALGLDVSMTPPLTQSSSRQMAFSLGADEEVFSASSLGVSDVEENKEEEEVNEVNRDIYQSRQIEGMSDLGGEMNGEKAAETDSEEDEKRQVLNAMLQVAEEDEGLTSSQAEVTADRIREVSDEDEETVSEDDTDTDISSSLETTEEEEEMEGEDKQRITDRQQVPPHIPTMLSKSGYLGPVRTYEIPAKSEVPSRNTDHISQGDHSQHLKKSGSEGEEETLLIKSNTDNDGNNFFHSQARGLFIIKEAIHFRERYEDKVEENRSGEFGVDGPIYESIRQPPQQDHDVPEGDRSSINESSNEDDNIVHQNLSKGERDRIEYKAFRADTIARQANEVQAETTQTVKKPSRVCIVM